jgi:hypothetical protein
LADSTGDFKKPLSGFFTSDHATNPNSSTSRGVVADSVFDAGSGTQSLTPTLITNTSTFGAATVGRGAVNLTSTKVDNTSTFGSHTLTKTYNATTTKVNNTSTFGTAVVSSTRNLTPTKVDNTSTFGSHTRTSTYTATTTKFDNTSIVGGSKTDMWTTYQSDFSQAIWLKGDIFSISSDWEHTADLITAGSASGQKYIYRNVTPGSVGLNSVIDFKLKYYDNVTYGHEWFQFLYGSAGWGLNSYVNININTGAIGTQGSNITSVTIIDLGDGWKRIIVTAPSTASGVAAPVGIFVVSGSTAARAETWDPANGRIFLGKEWNAYFTPSGFIHDVSQWGQDRTLTATTYNNTSTFGSHVVSSLNTLVPTKVNNASAFGAATITTGVVTLTPTKYNNSSTFGTHTITVSQALTATLFDQNYEFLLDENGDYVLDENDDPIEVLIDRFGAATITQGAGGTQTLTPTKYNNSSTFGTAVITGSYTLVPTKVNNTSTFGTPVLTHIVTPTKVNNTSTFGTAVITSVRNLTTTKVNNTSTFGAATITTGVVNLSPTLVTNSSTFGSPVLTRIIAPTKVNNTSTFGTAVVTSVKNLVPTKVDNTSVFGSLTNYTTDVSDYSTSNWTRTAITVTSDVEHIADKIAVTLASGTSHQLVTANLITPPSAGINYYFDFKIKYVDHDWIQVFFGQLGWGTNAWRNININDLTFGSGGVNLPTSNFTLTDLGNGWRRIQGYAVSTATGAAGFALGLIPNSTHGRGSSWTPSTATSAYVQEFYIFTKSGFVHDVSQWGQDQTLTPTLVTNTNTFGAATVSASYTLVPTNVTNASIVGGSYTELLANFSNFSAGTWSRSRVTATSDQDHVADIIAVTLVSGTHDLFRNNLTITSGNQYEIVLKAKYLSHSYIQLFYGNGFSATSYANFDVQTGAWGTIGAGVDSYYFIDHGDGYYTVSITATATSSTATGLLAMDLVPASTSGRQPSWLPSSTDGIYLKEFHGLESRSGFVHDVMQSGQDQTLTSTVLTNTSTFGSTVVTNLNTLVPTKVDNTSTFGSPTVSVGAAPLLPTLVTNTSTFGGHLVASGGIYASKVNNISTFGAATITTGGVTVNPPKVDNTSTFGVATIANIVAPTEVENTSTFGTPSVTSVTNLTTTKVNNTSLFGAKTDKFIVALSDFSDASWTRNGLSVSTNVEHIADRLTTNSSTGAFYVYKNITPDSIGRVYTFDIKVKYENNSWLQLLFTAAGWGLDSYVNININTGAIGTQGSNISEVIIDNLGNGWKRIRVSAPATVVGTGPVGVWMVSGGTAVRAESWTPGSGKTYLAKEWYCYEETSNGLIADVSQWGQDQTLIPTKVNNTSTFGAPVVTVSAVNLQPTILTNTNTFGSHLVSSGGIYATKVDNTSTFGSPTITTVNGLTPTVLTNTSSFGSAVITTDYDLIGSLFTSTSEFGAHSVSSVNELSPTIINNISTFGSHSVTTIYTLEPASLVNITSFGTPIVGRGTINLQPTIISDIDSFGIPVIEVIVDRTLYPPTYINTTIFGTPIVRNGVRLYPISDPVNSGWVNQDNSATNLYASVNEDINTDMESTYITDTGAGTNTVRFSLSTPGVAIYNKNNHKVRYKVRKELGTFPTLTVNLYQSTVRIAQWIHADLPTTYTIYERTLTVDQAILLSGYTDLYIEFITTY